MDCPALDWFAPLPPRGERARRLLAALLDIANRHEPDVAPAAAPAREAVPHAPLAA